MTTKILLIKNYDLIGRFIRWWTHSEYNHVALFIDNNYVIESRLSSGVVKTDFEEYCQKQFDNKLDFAIYEVKNLTITDKEKIIQFVVNQLGKGYDILQVLCIGLFYLIPFLRKYEPFDKSGWVCSELVAEAFYQANIKFSDNVDPDNITPKDICESELVQRIA